MKNRQDADNVLQDSSANAGDDSASGQPPLAAIFLIHFDLKVGYTIAWKRSIHDLSLEGVVEFKSLPSGLHNVKEDLVYFVHEQYAGVSAFRNRPASEAERNAQFLAVGILVPLSYGRLGRSWLYTKDLQELAKTLIRDTKNTNPLEQFWNQHKLPTISRDSSSKSAIVDDERPDASSPNGVGQRRKRALSTLTGLVTFDRELPRSHPILSVSQYVTLCGPLAFAIHRLALLRKRILFVTQPPVRSACNFVYDVSVLSSISSTLFRSLTPSSDAAIWLPTLFTVGVHDIPYLASEEASKAGWIACTTDEILGMKNELYDYIVELPESGNALQKWPRIKAARGDEVRATQRDLRRWRALRRALHSSSYQARGSEDGAAASDDGSETAGLLATSAVFDDTDETSYDSIVEPTSWSALAYSGFMWWASAGERDAALDAEVEQDAQLNGDLAHAPEYSSPRQYLDDPEQEADDGEEQENGPTDARLGMELLAYFHRYTHQILSTAVQVGELQETQDHDRDDSGNDKVIVEEVNLRQMGLDSWSEFDRQFVAELVPLYLDKQAEVKGSSIECCGVKIC